MGTPMSLEGRGLAIFVLAAVFMILSLTTVSLRCFVRSYIVRAFGWDDFLMLIALALFVILAICCMIGTSNGVGHQFDDFTSLVIYERALLWWWLSQMFYVWSSAVAKVSIAVALLRLTVNRVHRIILWSTITLTIIIGLIFWLVLLLDCHPISYFWKQANDRSTGSCLSVDILLDIAYLYSALTVVCDFTLGILPIFLVWHLQMNRRTKVAVGGILSLGAIASVAVIIRLPFLKYYADTDFLYSTYQIAVWTIIETGLGITAGSLITLRPLFRWLLDGSLSNGQNGRTPERSSGQYRLSSFRSGGAKQSQDPSLWRPDTSANDRTVDIMSLPRSKISNDASSSQEALNPPSSANPRNGVTVQRSFVQTVSDGGM
ncbi:Vacuolar protein sorting-associated VPS28 N-terminal [Penicillium atrosanguineum]|uniref:Vacuolar protein sorting-associated VPS28 N-terminal n=1 Tax=Penicillium atrosanguineum TaxID=1132637 RepID=UPI00238855F1|nr:Vacuolar protein sorting-associated VPS28 N-terminal [Penicillium atrosanguineum]KAJ5314717.1 Vacuolar protein sorting-associated VPS28 N-terminal [Penicillium atrosanguineum]